ncbi:MAG: hypothetical protein ACERKV_07795 [Clostridiaceae bacterium]
MRKEELNYAYEKLTTTEDMDKAILNGVINATRRPKKKIVLKTRYILAATLAVCICSLQLSPVKTYAKETIKSFSNYFEGADTEVKMIGKYIEISKNACNHEKKYSEISDIEKDLGINILKSRTAYRKDKYTVEYTPYVSKNGELYGAVISDSFYEVGDLKNVKAVTKKRCDDCNSITYKNGEEYKSPISCEITIRTDKDKEADYTNHELEYAGLSWNLDDNEIKSINVYNCEILNVKVLLRTCKTDGDQAWNDISGNIENMTIAEFIYDGIQYRYAGDVSYDTMQDFIDGLSYY